MPFPILSVFDVMLFRVSCAWVPFDSEHDDSIGSFGAAGAGAGAGTGAAAVVAAPVSTASSTPTTRNHLDPSALHTHRNGDSFAIPFPSCAVPLPVRIPILTSPLRSSFRAFVSFALNAVAACKDGRTKGAEREMCKGKGVIGGVV